MLDDDIDKLSKFLLIHNSDNNATNPIFEMHNIVAKKIQKINGNRINKIYLEDIILRLINILLAENGINAYLLTNSKTIHYTFKVISENAQKYNINIYKLLELNLHLIWQYANSYPSYNHIKLIDWFNENEQQGKFKLWFMSNHEKTLYASYLMHVGWYYRSICKWAKALEYYAKSQDILNKLKGYELIKYDVFCCLAEINIMLGDAQIAEENIQNMEKIVSNKQLMDPAGMIVLYTMKANLFELQGKYEEALGQINQSIKTLIDHNTDKNNILLSVRYILKSKILNSLDRYQEAYEQLKQLCPENTTIEKDKNIIYARIYTQLARSELAQMKLTKALEHINKAIELFLADEYRNPKDADYSEDPELASSYVVQGEIFFAQNNLKEAIECYKKANIIYFYLYGKNLKKVRHVSNLYCKGAKAACKLKDLYNYKFFNEQQIQIYGINHPNTIAILKYCKQYQEKLQ